MNKTEKVQHARTMGTVQMILEITKKIDVDTLIGDIFVWTDDPIVQKMIKIYEAQLLLARVNPVEFANTLHSFYKSTRRFILDNNLQKDFLSFVYFVFSSLKKKDVTYRDSLDCYLDILLQQFNYFVMPPHLIYGLDSKSRWLTRDEPFPYIDIALLELGDNLSIEGAKRAYEKYGYKDNSPEQILSRQMNDQLLTNMILIMSNFINEQTIDISPKEFYLVAHGMNMPRRINSNSLYREMLREKRYFLPNKGIKGVYKNAYDIAEVFFQEIFTENRFILLYKVTAKNGKEFCGFYDNKLELFFSPWTDTDGGNRFHNDIENIILESYCYLTTDIEEKESEEGFQKRLYMENDNAASPSSLTVKFLYEKERGDHKKDEYGFRPFDKKKYREIKMRFGARPRKLPMGAHASEEAIKLAKEYNYVIREGETFVRPFEKRVYKKEDAKK